MGAMKTILNLVNFATLTEKEKAQLLEVFQIESVRSTKS